MSSVISKQTGIISSSKTDLMAGRPLAPAPIMAIFFFPLEFSIASSLKDLRCTKWLFFPQFNLRGLKPSARMNAHDHCVRLLYNVTHDAAICFVNTRKFWFFIYFSVTLISTFSKNIFLFPILQSHWVIFCLVSLRSGFCSWVQVKDMTGWLDNDLP